jgi:hypothetical protein
MLTKYAFGVLSLLSTTTTAATMMAATASLPQSFGPPPATKGCWCPRFHLISCVTHHAAAATGGPLLPAGSLLALLALLLLLLLLPPPLLITAVGRCCAEGTMTRRAHFSTMAAGMCSLTEATTPNGATTPASTCSVGRSKTRPRQP